MDSGRFKFIGHQANFGMLKTTCELCGIPEEDHWYNIVEHGNAGCSGAPCTLSQRWDDLRPGDHIAMALVGGGLTWVRAMLRIPEQEH